MVASEPLYRTVTLFRAFPDLVAAESTRHGGVSPSPFASLNVGLNTEDDPENVEENRRRFFAGLGIDGSRVASSHQVHGDLILVAEEPGRYSGYDALITNRPELFLTVTVADCTPILIWDPVRKAVAAVHAGWRGTVAGLVEKTVRAMQEVFGTHPADCYGFVGTCIDRNSFEVGLEVAEQFGPAFRTLDPERGRFLVDLKAANAAQLTAAGFRSDRIEISPYSTVGTSQDYFSYRRENGRTGRMLALIGFRTP
ncbi:peptidoglycan editing factor PgeF [Larkinella soli]|uniref:peptidoglycan editing factor PgeF n=1 Tax=Larkinella soli TaxID=1770527 RepID=UPI000FFC9DD6|nr:peptidoglycan editing factor PgeF [Larkinella soli]